MVNKSAGLIGAANICNNTSFHFKSVGRGSRTFSTTCKGAPLSLYFATCTCRGGRGIGSYPTVSTPNFSYIVCKRNKGEELEYPEKNEFYILSEDRELLLAYLLD